MKFVKPWNKWDFIYYNLFDGRQYLKAIEKIHAFSGRVSNHWISCFTKAISSYKRIKKTCNV